MMEMIVNENDRLGDVGMSPFMTYWLGVNEELKSRGSKEIFFSEAKALFEEL
jgi:hypothetical protein